MKFKNIGILGGMGPEASANFYYKIIKYCQNKYKSVQDIDYPHVVIYSMHLQGFNETGILNQKNVLSQLIKGIKILENSGCDFIVIPCNTVHYFIEELSQSVKIPILSIIDETINKIKENKVGLIASETTMNLDIYQSKLKENNIDCLTPDKKDYRKITKLILEVMGGKVNNKTKDDVLKIIKKMNSESLVLGCTELPIVINQKDTKIKIYDTLQILSEATVDYAIS